MLGHHGVGATHHFLVVCWCHSQCWTVVGEYLTGVHVGGLAFSWQSTRWSCVQGGTGKHPQKHCFYWMTSVYHPSNSLQLLHMLLLEGALHIFFLNSGKTIFHQGSRSLHLDTIRWAYALSAAVLLPCVLLLITVSPLSIFPFLYIFWTIDTIVSALHLS